MNPLLNPFSPGAGTPPQEFAGRTEILDKASLALARIKRGRSEKSLLLIGLRGVGKTVLLNHISKIAENEGYQALVMEAREKKTLPELLVPKLRELLIKLDMIEGLSEKVKRGFRVLQSFVSIAKLKIKTPDGIEYEMGIDAERGVADSGDIESDLTQLFIALGEAAKDRSTAIALIIDEMQYLSEEELSAIMMAVHRISQLSLPLIVIGAGLPQLRGKAGDAKSYAERLFDYPEIGALADADAKKALQIPAQSEGASFTDDALEEIVSATEGYPYFLQEWGYQAWNAADTKTITLEVAQKAKEQSIRKLDKNFFLVRYDRLTPKEKDYLRAMAELGAGPYYRSGDIAEKIGVEIQQVAPFRGSLIKKGMIYSPAHGDTAFTVPLFGDFMKRVIPTFERYADK